jgi:murein DD-endopeptidase MepM/ murein hydrolase activator NlpD
MCSLLACSVAASLLISTSAQAGTGGANVVIVPQVKVVQCKKACARGKAVQSGSLVRVKGSDLAGAAQVIFLGAPGKSDDAPAGVLAAREKTVLTRVPGNAVSGPVVVITAAGARSRATAPILVRPRPPVIGSPDLQPVKGISAASGLGIETGTSTPRVVFLGSKQLVRFSFRLTGTGGDSAVTVSLVRESDGLTVRTWDVVAPDGQIASVDWDGTAAGKAQGYGRYAFRIALTAPQGAAISTSAASDPDRDAFDLYGYMFPVRGKHNFGQSGARFGAGRPGHRHQGQDVMAACGVPLVAARGGTVVKSTFQSAAGNYLVIRSDFDGGDQAYMHLQTKSPFVVGDRVYTGQTIGNVGRTGRASACHLHFEQWGSPGWYAGGKPFDPLPDLMAWDAVS